MKFRVFTNDRGPNTYSAFCYLTADTLEDAKTRARSKTSNLPTNHTLKVLVVPEDRFREGIWAGHGIRANVSEAAQKEFII